MLELTVENVQNIFFDCLFEQQEDKSNPKIILGIRNNYGFNPVKLIKNTDQIKELISQLPETFNVKYNEFNLPCGGGGSFLNLCENKQGVLWTGEHMIMEQLVCLGLAIDKIEYLLPKEMWRLLPGNMPFLFIK